MPYIRIHHHGYPALRRRSSHDDTQRASYFSIPSPPDTTQELWSTFSFSYRFSWTGISSFFYFSIFFPPSFHYVHIYSWRSHHYCINLVHSSAERRSVGVVVLLLLLLLFVYIVVRVRRPSPFYKWNLMHHWMLVMTES